MGKKKGASSYFDKTLAFIHEHVTALNGSKFFAGMMIITLNIVSKFVHIKLGKTMESFLKFSFSRNILVFSIAWMGTRDIYIALTIMFIFILFTEYLFHEESALFILPDSVKDYHIELLDNEVANKDQITEEEVVKAKMVLEKAEKQKNNTSSNMQGYPVSQTY